MAQSSVSKTAVADTPEHA